MPSVLMALIFVVCAIDLSGCPNRNQRGDLNRHMKGNTARASEGGLLALRAHWPPSWLSRSAANRLAPWSALHGLRKRGLP